MDVACKGWLAAIHDLGKHSALTCGTFWVSFLFNALFLIIMRAGTIHGCAKCDVLIFMPLNIVLNVFLSVATGMVVLDEGRHVQSWVGLSFSMISVIGGIVMLVTGPAKGSAPDEAELEAEEAKHASGTLTIDSASLHASTHCAVADGAAMEIGGPSCSSPAPGASLLHMGSPASHGDDEEAEDAHESDSSDTDVELDEHGVEELVSCFTWVNRPVAMQRLNNSHQQAAASRSQIAKEIADLRVRDAVARLSAHSIGRAMSSSVRGTRSVPTT